eukprot:104396_1
MTPFIGNICWLALAIVGLTLIAWMTIDFLLHEYDHKKGLKCWKIPIDQSLSLSMFILLILFAIHCITNTMYAIMAETSGTFNPIWCLSQYVLVTWYSFSKMCVFTFYIVRLGIVFNNSSFAVSLTRLKLLTLFILLPSIVMSIMGFYMVWYVASHYDPDKYPMEVNTFRDCSIVDDIYTPPSVSIFKYISLAVYFLSELIYSIIILRLFLSRVLLLSLSFNQMQTRVQSRGSKGSKGARSRSPSKTRSNSGNTIQSDVDADALDRVRSETDIDLQNADSETRTKREKKVKFKNRKKRATSEARKMELRNTELFLNLAIKTTNLIIFVVVTNYLALVKFGAKINPVLLMIDAVCNCFAVYVSFRFSSRHYDRIFGLCHTHCYECCAQLCYCCCLRTQLVAANIMADPVPTNSPSQSPNESQGVVPDILTI